MKPSDVSRGTTETLGGSLERDRLARRARRVTAVIAELRQQAGRQRSEVNTRTRSMLKAIEEFEEELAAINARLNERAAGLTERHP